MKIVCLVLFFLSLFSIAFAHKGRSSSETIEKFRASIGSVPKKIQGRMQPGCPIAINQFAYVKLTYWGFDQKPHQGVLIVNKVLAREVVEIFKVLYLNKFPIHRMALMDEFNHDDNLAMAANNTSAFHCRPVTGQPGILSQHSYGRAIDINPLINPYVKGSLILPPQGASYANRLKASPGKITKNSVIYHEFIKRGWDWGGSWYDVKDYQHFEKRANGERRNPNGY